MSRVINPNGPGKERNHLMRTSAEVIRRLSEKQEFDGEARDMTAFLVYCFRAIGDGIEESVRAWEKRDYWVKAEQFRIKWSWVIDAANRLENMIIAESWDDLPANLIPLIPHFEDIKIAKYTRKPSMWQGAHERLMQELEPR